MFNEDVSGINMIYNINRNIMGENIYIFGYKFVKNNKNNCKLIIKNMK